MSFATTSPTRLICKWRSSRLCETATKQTVQKAIDHLRQLYRVDSEDAVVRLALAELLVEESGSKRNGQTVVRLAEGIENDSEIHDGLLLYKAEALAFWGCRQRRVRR